MGDYQVSVDKAVPLQVFHPFTHILAHAQQHVSAKMTLSLSKKVQQAAPFHELRNNVDWLLLSAHTIELH